VTSVFKIRKKIRKSSKIKFVKIRFITVPVTAKFSNSHNTSSHDTEATVEWEQWALGSGDRGLRF